MKDRYWIPAAIPSRVLGTGIPMSSWREQVVVPNGAVTFPTAEVSTMTTRVISFTVSMALAEENTYLFFPARLRDWVGSYYCCPRGRCVDLHFLNRTTGGGNVPSRVQPRCGPFYFRWSCCVGQTSKHQRGWPALERTARGPLDYSFRLPEWCSWLRSALLKESWRLPTGAR